MFHKSLELTLIALLILSTVVLLWACAPSQSQRRVVAVSIGPQSWLVHHLAGDSIDVHVVVPAGSSPETYDPTPQDMVRLSDCALYLSMRDLGFERAWLPRFEAQNVGLKVVDCTRSIERHVVGRGEADPHVWTTPANLRHMSDVMTEALQAEWPELSDMLDRRHSTLAGRLDSLDVRLRQLATIAPTRSFVIYHPALTYLCEAYGLRQIAVESDHKEPSPADMQTLVDEVGRSDAKVVLMQQELDPRLVETLARETGLRVVSVNLLSLDWETELIRVVLEVTR